MASVKSFKGTNSVVIFFTIICSSVTVSSFSQTQQSFRNHEEIDVGGGMKVEILKCTGEGPTEECDCIYFTDKRQNGLRMKQSANRLKEEQRAAELAKSINKPGSHKGSVTGIGSSDHRPDKVIPESIKPRPNSARTTPAVTLQDAARRADSIANARSEKLKESLSQNTPSNDDTADMDQVFIPKVTDDGKAMLEGSIAKKSADTSIGRENAMAVNKQPEKDTAAPVPVGNAKQPVTANPPAAPKETSASVNSGRNTTDSNAAQLPVAKDHDAAPAISIAPLSVSNPSASSASSAVIKKDTTSSAAVATSNAAATPTGNSASTIKDSTVAVSGNVGSDGAQPVDSTENGWVKQYNNVRRTDTATSPTPKKVQNAEKSTVPTPAGRINETTATSQPPENGTKGSGVMNSPLLHGSGREDDELKKKQPENRQEKTDTASSRTVATTGNSADVVQPNAATKDQTAAPDSISTLAKTNSVDNNPNTANVNNTANKGDLAANEKPASSTVTLTNVAKPVAADRSVLGKTAEVNSRGEWEKATIVDKETEFLYKVHYKGTTADQDEWVAVTQIRNIDTATHLTAATDKPNKAANVNCGFEAPAPPVANADKFSEKLAKRKIYDNYMAEKKRDGVKSGVTFLSIKTEEPYVNTVSISPANTLKLKLSLAPAGAMIYPVETQFKLCEQVLGKTSSKTVNANYACFRNKLGGWACEKVE